jgi:hypothetical protein
LAATCSLIGCGVIGNRSGDQSARLATFAETAFGGFVAVSLCRGLAVYIAIIVVHRLSMLISPDRPLGRL